MSDKRPYPEVKTVVDQCVSDVLGRTMLDLPNEDHIEALSQVIERLTHVIERAAPILERTKESKSELCSDCPPTDYPTDKTRCVPCPRKQGEQA